MAFRIYRYDPLPSGPAGEMRYTLTFVGTGYAFPKDIAAGRRPEQAAVLDRIRIKGPLAEGMYVALPDEWPGVVYVSPDTQTVSMPGAEPATWQAGEARV